MTRGATTLDHLAWLLIGLVPSLLPGCSFFFPWTASDVSDAGPHIDSEAIADSAVTMDSGLRDSATPMDSTVDSRVPDAGSMMHMPWESCDGGTCSVCLFNKAHPLGGSSSIPGLPGETGQQGAEVSNVGPTGQANIYIVHDMVGVSTQSPIGTAVLAASSTTVTQSILLSDAPSTWPDIGILPSGDLAVLTLGTSDTGDSGYLGILRAADLSDLRPPLPTSTSAVQAIPGGCIAGGGLRLDGSRWPLRAMYGELERGTGIMNWSSVHYDALGTMSERSRVDLATSPTGDVVVACSDGGLGAVALDSTPDTIWLSTGYGIASDSSASVKTPVVAPGRTGGPVQVVYRGAADSTNDAYWLIWTVRGDVVFAPLRCPGLCGAATCPGGCEIGLVSAMTLGVSDIPQLLAFAMPGGGLAIVYRSVTVEHPTGTSVSLRLLRDDLSTVLLDVGGVGGASITELPFTIDGSDVRAPAFLYGSIRSDADTGEIVLDEVTVAAVDAADPSSGFVPTPKAVATCPR